jgi:AbrB family looped-hinge helix DNA binding protein
MKNKLEPRSRGRQTWGGVTISSKGQVTIPKEVREALHLKPGDRVTFESRNGQAVLRREPSFLELGGSIEPPYRPLDFRKVREEVKRRIAAEVAAEGQ